MAVVVIIGLPFLDQLTAIAQKYVSTSQVSNSVLISFWAVSVFADFTHHVVCMAVSCEVVCFGVGWGIGVLSS